MPGDNTAVWCMRAGRKSEADDLFLRHGTIAIGWNALGDLSAIDGTRAAFRAAYAMAYPAASPGVVAADAGQVFRFVREMAPGDVVVYASKRDRRVHIGFVAGPYAYNPALDTRYPHQRPVAWKTAAPRERFTPDALTSLNAAMTLFSLKGHAAEFRQALGSGSARQAVPTERPYEPQGPRTIRAHREGGRFTVPQDMCAALGVTSGDTILLSLSGPHGSIQDLPVTLRSGTEVYGPAVQDCVKAGDQITIIIRRAPAPGPVIVTEQTFDAPRQLRETSTNAVYRVPAPGSALFTERTFDLLRQLHETPTKTYYQRNGEAFKSAVEEPFRRLMRAVAAGLPASIRAVMETERRVFGRILKNDHGRGGAWDFYWGAFYPRGAKRNEAPQLILSIDPERLEFGFYIGEYDTTFRERLVRNVRAHHDDIAPVLAGCRADGALLTLGRRTRGVGPHPADERAALPRSAPQRTLEDWLERPAADEVRVAVTLPRTGVVGLAADDLARRIVESYRRVFALVLLALSDDPMPALHAYLRTEGLLEAPALDGPPTNPPYTLADLSGETGFPVAELERWVRALERKGQVILYGPPGTGKTYLAERLARHLVAAEDGFSDLVQFHPAYGYEDFIQGIRPTTGAGGGLGYPLVPGRFLEFCRKAREHSGRCVLIIDEVNRADLGRVFGELMYLLEYRGAAIRLASGGEKPFSIPSNVRLIGTMNTADRSIALVDYALRRRFAFLEVAPRAEVLRAYHATTGFAVEGLIGVLHRLNQQIADPHYAVGVTFFLHRDLAAQIEDIWRVEIEPYLAEYFFDRPERAREFGWDMVAGSILP